ncbi:MAG: hypothetical protein ACTMIR_12075 [Cellulomonadaceae bacterium]
MDTFLQALGALIPSVGVGVLFYFAIRAIVRADRNERAAVAQYEAEHRVAADSERAAGVPVPPEPPRD